MALNSLGVEKRDQPSSVTLPQYTFKTGNIEQEVKEDAAHRDMVQTIKAGQDAWQEIRKAETFEAWVKIGKALAIGRDVILRATGANAPMGGNYNMAFSQWMKQHKFDRIPRQSCTGALKLIENLAAIEAWRLTLSEKQRRRFIHPLSNVRRWQAATGQTSKPDKLMKAEAAWRRFVSCLEALSSDQAMPLWQAIHAQASARIAA